MFAFLTCCLIFTSITVIIAALHYRKKPIGVGKTLYTHSHNTVFPTFVYKSFFFFLNLKLGVEPSRITSLFFFFLPFPSFYSEKRGLLLKNETPIPLLLFPSSFCLQGSRGSRTSKGSFRKVGVVF